MNRKCHPWRTILLGALLLAPLGGSPALGRTAVPAFQRDSVLEQALRYDAHPDKTITPARVLRWLRSLTGRSVPAGPSAVEFTPVLQARNDIVRIQAQVLIRF